MPTEAQEARGELLDHTDSSARVSMAEVGAGEERGCTLHLGGGWRCCGKRSGEEEGGSRSFIQQTCIEHPLCALCPQWTVPIL